MLFKAAVVVWLCSGVAMMTPSAFSIRCFKYWTAILLVWSSSSLNIGTSLMLKTSMSATLLKRLAMYSINLRLYESAVIEPTIPTNFICLFPLGCHIL